MIGKWNKGSSRDQYNRFDGKHRINNSCTWGSKHALVIRGLKLFNFFQFENSRGLNSGFAYALCREFQEYLEWFFREGGYCFGTFFAKTLNKLRDPSSPSLL
jgi:hypothetical protein